MTIVEKLYDYEKARLWRERHRYTRKQLSRLTGFSESSILDFETGIVKGDRARPVDPNAMHRYRLILAAISHDLTDWDWEDSK